MLQKVNARLAQAADFLAGLKMTIVSGVFLAFSLALLIAKNFAELNISPWLDPALVTVVISGYPLLYLALYRLIGQRWVSSALLITVAMIASLCLAEVFAAGEVAFIMAIGAILEDKTAERAKKGLNNLIKLTPQTGRVIFEDGETIPVDGKIISGATSVDQSVMTGESLPVDKGEGDEVFCGTMNCYGAVDMIATNVGEDSSLQKMIRLLRDAENKKAPMQRIADKWATWLVPVAVAIAVITGIVTYFVVGNENNAALIRAVTVLVVFCPCALVLATPTAVIAGIGQATKYGVLIKSGEAMESMGRANCIAFDKTGTLTLGKLTVSDVLTFGDISESQLLAKTAAIESRSEHPLGKAVAAYAKERGLALPEVENFAMTAGRGVSGSIGGEICYCGSRRYLEECGVAFGGENDDAPERLRKEGKAVIFVAHQEGVLGAIGLSDTLRPAAKETVRKLKKLGCEVVLLTGDHWATAQYFAGQAGIANAKAELLPQDKVTAVEQLQKQGYDVCMIGDGVNDAPALKTADVGVAMGGEGSDIAAEAAGIALIGGDIEKLPYLCMLARATLKTIRFSIALSMTINLVAIVLSSLGLLTPITGAIVHNAGSVFVVLIAALLYDRKLFAAAEKL